MKTSQELAALCGRLSKAERLVESVVALEDFREGLMRRGKDLIGAVALRCWDEKHHGGEISVSPGDEPEVRRALLECADKLMAIYGARVQTLIDSPDAKQLSSL